MPARRGLPPEHRKRAGERPEQISGQLADGGAYNFPADLDNQDIRKRIEYADIKGIKGYNCGNCYWYLLGYCRKFHIKVKSTACCREWKSRGKS